MRIAFFPTIAVATFAVAAALGGLADRPLVAAALAAETATETPAQTCDTPQKITEGIIAASAKKGFAVSVYDEVTDPTMVARFVEAFNETPPASNISADMVMLYAAKHAASGTTQPGRLAIFFSAGCQVPKAGMMFRDADVERIIGPAA